MQTILNPPRLYLLSKKPFINGETLMSYPDLEECGYRIENVEVLKSLPKLRKAYLYLPEGGKDPLHLLPNISPEVEFKYTVKVGKDVFYYISNKNVYTNCPDDLSLLRFLRERGIQLVSYSGKITTEIKDELLKFPSLCELQTKGKYLSFVTHELLSRLTSLRIIPHREEERDDFIARIKGKTYPKMIRVRLLITQEMVLSFRYSFPRIKSIYIRLDTFSVNHLPPTLGDFKRVYLKGSTEYPHKLSLGQVYPTIISLKAPIRVKDIPKTLTSFPKVRDIYIWKEEGKEIPWHLLTKKRVYLCQEGGFPELVVKY